MGNTEKVEMIDLTPNYPAIFQRYHDEIAPETERAIDAAKDGPAPRYTADKELNQQVQEQRLRSINGLLSAIAIALNSITSTEELEQLRATLADAQKRSSDAFQQHINPA